MSSADRSAPPGLDVDAFMAWLGQSTDGTPAEVRQLAGGRSNLTYEVRVGGERLVVRRPPLGNVLRGAHDVVREHSIVEALQGSSVPVPEPIALCRDEDVLGAPFSVVRHVEGVTLRAPADVRMIEAPARDSIVDGFGRVLAHLHAIDPAVSGRIAASGRDFVHRQFRAWRRQLEAEPVRDLHVVDELGSKLEATAPTQKRVSIVHGDYRLDNAILAQDGAVRAVLDWELWTLGDPMADLGTTIAYWTDSRYELAPLGAAPTQHGALGDRERLVTAYERASGLNVDRDELQWHVAFGVWRYAAILEGVYRRNQAEAYGKHPTDDAWRRLEYVVPALAEMGLAQLADA